MSTANASPILVCAAAVLAAVPTAWGQTVEITPMGGYRVGGSFSAAAASGPEGPAADLEVEGSAAWGVHLGFRVATDGEVELLYARQPTQLRTGGLFTGAPVFDLTLETWQLGGLYLFAEEDARVRPYVGAGIGVTRLLPGPPGLQDETRFSASLAAGAKVYLGRHLAFRLEGRGFFTVLESDSNPFCGTGTGHCDVSVTGTAISQGEIRGGIALRF
jgi:outer membrane protein W